MKETYILYTDEPIWHIFFVAACGSRTHVAEVVEPLSENPGVMMHCGFGLQGLKHIISLIDAERKVRLG